MSFYQDKLQFYYITRLTRVRYARLATTGSELSPALIEPARPVSRHTWQNHALPIHGTCQYAVLWNQTENAVMTRIFKSSASDQCSI